MSTMLEELKIKIKNLNNELQNLDYERNNLLDIKNQIREKENTLAFVKKFFMIVQLVALTIGTIIFTVAFFKQGLPLIVSAILGITMTSMGPVFNHFVFPNYSDIKKFLKENNLEDVEQKLKENADNKILIQKQIKDNTSILNKILADNGNSKGKTKQEINNLNNHIEKQEYDYRINDKGFQKKIGTKTNKNINSNK